MSYPEIGTERLILRRWRDEDVNPFAEICADPEVMRYIADGSTRTLDEAADGIRQFETQWDELGYGLFAVEQRADQRMIGFAGFIIPEFLPEIMPAVELGWRLARDTWGTGIATEAARAAMGFGWSQLGFERLVSVVQDGNVASIRVAEKLGMTVERETVVPDPGCDVRVYEINRPD